jgi:hypothetical protein
MSAINVIKAHFDGTSIQLDEPVTLPVNTPLLVTVATADSEDNFQAEWTPLSKHGLSLAYGENEPVYSPSDIMP